MLHGACWPATVQQKYYLLSICLRTLITITMNIQSPLHPGVKNWNSRDKKWVIFTNASMRPAPQETKRFWRLLVFTRAIFSFRIREHCEQRIGNSPLSDFEFACFGSCLHGTQAPVPWLLSKCHSCVASLQVSLPSIVFRPPLCLARVLGTILADHSQRAPLALQPVQRSQKACQIAVQLQD